MKINNRFKINLFFNNLNTFNHHESNDLLNYFLIRIHQKIINYYFS